MLAQRSGCARSCARLIADRRGRRIRHRPAAGVSTLMRRRCGCSMRPATSLTRANAISAASSFFDSVVDIHRGESGRDLAVGLGAVLHAVDERGELRIGRERRVAHHVRGEDAPLAVVLDRDQDVGAVLRLEHAVGRDRGMRRGRAASATGRPRAAARERSSSRRSRRRARPGCRALAGALAFVQCREDRVVSVQARRRCRTAKRRLLQAPLAGDRHKAASVCTIRS